MALDAAALVCVGEVEVSEPDGLGTEESVRLPLDDPEAEELLHMTRHENTKSVIFQHF